MPHHAHIKVEGRIGDIFSHRFVIELSDGTKILADVGPRGADAFRLETGTQVTIEGEMKPSELKVERIARRGGEAAVTVEHKKKHPPHEDHHHEHADPDAAKRTVKRAGFEPLGNAAPQAQALRGFGAQGRPSLRMSCHIGWSHPKGKARRSA